MGVNGLPLLIFKRLALFLAQHTEKSTG